MGVFRELDYGPTFLIFRRDKVCYTSRRALRWKKKSLEKSFVVNSAGIQKRYGFGRIRMKETSSRGVPDLKQKGVRREGMFSEACLQRQKSRSHTGKTPSWNHFVSPALGLSKEIKPTWQNVLLRLRVSNCGAGKVCNIVKFMLRL